MSNYHFTHREDAVRHQKSVGGIIHDNRHTAHEWNDNQFTVHTEPKARKKGVYYGEIVTFTKDQFEDWMEAKGWNERVRDIHRREFTGTIEFDDEGSFEHV